MKKLLFISRVFPPEGGSAVQRPVKFVKYLKQYKWFTTVVTCCGKGGLYDDSFLNDIPSDIPVERCISAEPKIIQSYMKGVLNRSGWITSIFNIIFRIYSIVYYRLAIPDASIGWVPFGLFKCHQLLNKNKFDLIYIHNQPPSSFLIGIILKKYYRLPLVLDYDDPWTTDRRYSEGNIVKYRISKIMEKIVLHNADLVIYCKEKVREGIIANFKTIDRSKLVFIPNGYDPADFKISMPEKKEKRMRLVYTGKLSHKFCYSPESFFTALSDMKSTGMISHHDIEVILIGEITSDYLNMIQVRKIQDMVHHAGYMNHRQCIKYLKTANGLLLIIESVNGLKASKEYAGSIPAKIFEYIFTGKPVLAIIPEGPEKDLLNESGLGFFAQPNNSESVKEAVMEILVNFQTKNQVVQPNWETIRDFSRQKLTQRLSDNMSLCLYRNYEDKEYAYSFRK